jgi:hypothetical protein
MTSVDFQLGPSRTAPYRLVDRTIPNGTLVPRPFDIQHGWKSPLGRSSGGVFYRTNFEMMTWLYAIGIDTLYTDFMKRYNPVNPWVWLHVHEPHTNAVQWFEGCMLEPKLTRSAGMVIQNLIIPFIHVVRYDTP